MNNIQQQKEIQRAMSAKEIKVTKKKKSIINNRKMKKKKITKYHSSELLKNTFSHIERLLNK